MSRISRTSANKTKGIEVRAPVEKILEMLGDLKTSTKDKNLKNELQWAIEMIATNQLYEPIIGEGENKEAKSEVRYVIRIYKMENNKLCIISICR